MSDHGAAKVLRDAAAIVDKGWVQGVHASASTNERDEVYLGSPMAKCHCAQGAMLLAAGPARLRPYEASKMPDEYWRARGALLDHLRGVINIGTIPGWNDAAQQTGNNVAATLRLVASQLES